LLGHTNVELAEFFGIAESTIYEWIKDHPSFAESLQKGREIANMEVVRALHKKAKGYEEQGRHYPPDTAAMIFFLKNRKPEKWQDRREVAVTGNAEDLKALIESKPS